MKVSRREGLRYALVASTVPFLPGASTAPALGASPASKSIVDALAAGFGDRRVFELGGSLERLSSTIRLPVGAPRNNIGFILRGRGWNLQAVATSSGFDASAIDTAALLFDRSAEEGNNNASIVLSDFAVVGGNRPHARGGRQHGIAGTVNSLDVRNVLVQHMSGHGWHLTDSFSNRISNGLTFGNYGDGLRFQRAANALQIESIRAYANGRAWRGEQGNLVILAKGSSLFGSVLRNCDVSYSGYTAWSYAEDTIESITVTRGLCTVTTKEPHGLTSGDVVFLRGVPGTGLTSRKGHRILAVGQRSFGFPVAAPDGRYDRARVPHARLGPFSHGLYVNGAQGMRVEGLYAEDCGGPGGYFTDSAALTLSGGFMLNCDMIVERCRGVEIGGIKFQGESALMTVEETDRTEINVLSSNVFTDGAEWVHGGAFMYNGVRFVDRRPQTGDWQVGEFAVLWNARAGDPFGYMLTANGWNALGSIDRLPTAPHRAAERSSRSPKSPT